MTKKNSNEMSFLDHLEDLRWHLIRSTLAILIAGIAAFTFSRFIFDTIIFGPKNMSFPTYKYLCKMSQFFNLDSTFCAESFPFSIQNRTMGGQFSADIWTAIYSGMIIAFPYIIYQLWSFISPGLHPNERKHSRGFILVTSLLFFMGVLFGYYVVTPLSINFLGTYSVSAEITNEIDLGSYISLVRSSSLASGFVFELPIIMYFLTKIGIITPQILRKYRRYALVIILFVSAVITPPDVASQIIVAIPILILYEVSIYISAIVVKNQNRKKSVVNIK